MFSDEMPKGPSRAIERVLILSHHLWVLSFAFGALPLPMGLLWLGVSEVVGGLLLGFVFVQSHNGMEVYNEEKDFYTAQVCACVLPRSPLRFHHPPAAIRSSLCPLLFPSSDRKDME